MSSAPALLPLTIAQAGSEDLDAVMVVMNAAFEPQFGEAWTRTQCAGILPMSGVRLTLARVGDQPVGFSLIRSAADEAELLLVAVSPSARSQGVGSALIRQFEDDARQAGCTRLHLEVRDGNRAIDLYARHDFKIEGRRAKYYRGADGQLFDALTMSRVI